MRNVPVYCFQHGGKVALNCLIKVLADKIIHMKSAQLEILLFTDTRFSSRQFCEKYDTGNQKNFAEYKSLEAAF